MEEDQESYYESTDEIPQEIVEMFEETKKLHKWRGELYNIREIIKNYYKYIAINKSKYPILLQERSLNGLKFWHTPRSYDYKFVKYKFKKLKPFTRFYFNTEKPKKIKRKKFLPLTEMKNIMDIYYFDIKKSPHISRAKHEFYYFVYRKGIPCVETLSDYYGFGKKTVRYTRWVEYLYVVKNLNFETVELHPETDIIKTKKLFNDAKIWVKNKMYPFDTDI